MKVVPCHSWLNHHKQRIDGLNVIDEVIAGIDEEARHNTTAGASRGDSNTLMLVTQISDELVRLLRCRVKRSRR